MYKIWEMPKLSLNPPKTLQKSLYEPRSVLLIKNNQSITMLKSIRKVRLGFKF